MGVNETDPNGSCSWDIHAHVVPQAVVDAARSRKYAMTINPESVLTLPKGRLILPRFGGGARFADGLHTVLADRMVLSVPPALLRYDMPGSEAEAWSELVNDGVADACRVHAGCYGFAYLPLHQPRAALRELERRRGQPWLGYVIGSSVLDKPLDDPALLPVYEALNAMRAFVFVHPVDALDARLRRFYLANLLGNPVETGLAMATLIFSGLTCTFPGIRFAFAHGGGVAAQLAGRWQRGYETARPGIEKLGASPLELLGQFYVDSVVHSVGALELCIKVFGLNHVLPGTDYPFPMGEDGGPPSSRGWSELDGIQILYRNAPAVFGLNESYNQVD
ncbi:MAG: amidohydrolase family protein [Bacilli bacterium]